MSLDGYKLDVVLASGKTFTVNNTLTLSGTDSSTLNIGTGGTLGTAAYTASSAYEVSGAVSTHAALITGVHGLVITTAKTFTLTNSLTLSGTDSSTLNIGTGGTLGTAAYTAASAYQVVDASLTSISGLTYVSDSFIKLTAEDTYAVRTIAETKTDLSLNNVTNESKATMFTAPTFTTSANFDYATASELVSTDGSKNLVSLAVATYPSLTELSYVKGVTSGIQGQINAIGTGGSLLVDGNGFGLDNSSVGRDTLGTSGVSLEFSLGGSGYGALGDKSFTCGSQTIASGDNSHAIGNTTIASGANSNTEGDNTTASGSSSHAEGSATTSSGEYSHSGGIYSIASHYGEHAHASGRFAAEGDCQDGKVQARIATAATDEVELFLDGTDDQFTLDDNDAYTCKVTVMGAQADGSIGDAVYQVKINRQGTTTALSQTLQTILVWDADTNVGAAAWAITADDTNEALKITVTPANATATRWTAVIEYVKINY